MANTMDAGPMNLDLASISLEQEEEKGVVIKDDDSAEEAIDNSMCLVGEFFMDGVVNFNAMKQAMETLWCPRKVHDLPIGFMFEQMVSIIGNYVGEYIEADFSNFTDAWRSYMRLRVWIDVRNPLKRCMKLKKSGGEWVWVVFKYKRLPTFCFIYGKLGHSERFCEQDYPSERPFGV
ncbi:hypothetical protein GH714_003079 [Hevea brasiliensis]|uniref:Zinc knuckle CX2CX4HX4C domain-containing protein n=1 Tax=Hevea brasiliensis TaxID=3981 RepID=A0A6A6MLE1_HEVBR|nr:hypothetical protein GH714_003079 [Hevea brasiliensis]